MFSITLLSLGNRIHLASFTSYVLQDFEYNLTTKNSSSSNSSSLISSSVVIEDNFLNDGVISSMDVHVSKMKNNGVASQPLNAWKNENAKYLSGTKILAIW